MYSGSESNTVTAKKVEERWTPTTVHAVFALPPLSRNKKSGSGAISVDLPLPSLGWTFALSLSPEYHKKPVKKGGPKPSSKSSSIVTDEWNPVALAFHRRGRVIPWENAYMHTELSLTADPPTDSDSPPLDVNSDGLSLANDAPPCTSGTPPCPSNNSTLLVTMPKITLAHSHSLELQLAPCTLSLLSPSKISLTLTISECPFSTGVFHVTSGGADEADAQKWLAKRSGDRLLNQSLTTGRVYDVRFLASSARSTSGSNGESLLETHAWLSVLEGHVNPSLARLSEVWTTALAAHVNPDAKPVVEIPCPDGYEYELDSDYDEDEAVEPVASLLPGEHDSATLLESRTSVHTPGLHALTLGSVPVGESDSKTEELRFGSPFSSFERDGVSDVSSLDSLPEEFIKDQEVPPDSSSKITTDCERTIVIKFAAHRTWYAFLWYCYTGDIEFCELQSQVEHGIRRLRVIGDGAPSCSPKSMYRLAHLVGDKALKALTLKAIRARMTSTNVLGEMFSVFTSKYRNVLKAQLDVLIEHRASPEVKKALLVKFSKSGVMPHAEPALEALYDRLMAMQPVIPATADDAADDDDD